MKKIDFRIVSDQVCAYPGCTKHLKQNLVNSDPNATYCFRHYMAVVRKNPRYVVLPNGKVTIKPYLKPTVGGNKA